MQFWLFYLVLFPVLYVCKDQLGKVANPARGQLNRENKYFSVHVRA